MFFKFDLREESISITLTGFALAWGIAASYYLLLRNLGPFGDEGSYCTIAEGITNGYVPYIDFFNEKTPLHYYWTALIFSLFGSGIEGSRIASSILLGLALSLALHQLARTSRSTLPLIFWSLVLASTGIVMRAYNNLAESTLALLFLASLVLALKTTSATTKSTHFLIGLLHGLACGYRQTSIITALVALFTPWHKAPRWIYFAGTLAALAFWIGLIGNAGMFPEAFDATVLFHLDNPERDLYFKHPGPNSIGALGLWILISSMASLSAYKNKKSWVIIWLIAAALPYFGRADAFRLWPSSLMGITYLMMTSNQYIDRRNLFIFGFSAVTLVTTINNMSTFEKDQSISEVVSEMSMINDTIWVGPFMPNVYCISNRRPASRFYFALPWTMKLSAKKRLVKDLTDNRPKLIVDVSDKWLSLDTLVPEIGVLIKNDYILAKDTGLAKFYLRKGKHSAQSPSMNGKHV